MSELSDIVSLTHPILSLGGFDETEMQKKNRFLREIQPRTQNKHANLSLSLSLHYLGITIISWLNCWQMWRLNN